MTTLAPAPSRGLRERAQSAAAKAAPRAPVGVEVRAAVVDAIIFWMLVGALAWLPFWYGSNDLLAWGVNAMLFPGLAIIYELALLIRGERHPVALRNLALPAALLAGAGVWIWLQTVTWMPAAIVHPIWGMAATVLERPVAASISVNRDMTMLGLIGLATAASAFWLALQLCRDPWRANLLLKAFAVIVCVYAAYGLLAFVLKAGRIPFFETPTATAGFVSSTFINRNSFATYAGMGLVVICGLILQLYRHEVGHLDGPRGLRVAALIEATGRRGIFLIAGAFLILVAMLLTGSRGGIIASGLGLIVLVASSVGRGQSRAIQLLETLAFTGALLALAFFAFGDVFVGHLAQSGLGDSPRMNLYQVIARSILDAPISGYGYAAFTDIFPIYRDGTISVHGTYEQAHNTYLETLQGLGLIGGAMLIVGLILLVLRCVRGAVTRQENATVPCVAAGISFLVGIQALVDFSLQMQAIAVTFAVMLGVGVAQSDSSRVVLRD
jgi:O-antigen ligase